MLNSCNPTLASVLFSLSLLMLASRRPISPSGTANRQAANRIEETTRTDAAPAGEGKTRWQLLVRAAMGARAQRRGSGPEEYISAHSHSPGWILGWPRGNKTVPRCFLPSFSSCLVLSCVVSSRLESLSCLDNSMHCTFFELGEGRSWGRHCGREGERRHSRTGRLGEQGRKRVEWKERVMGHAPGSPDSRQSSTKRIRRRRKHARWRGVSGDVMAML